MTRGAPAWPLRTERLELRPPVEADLDLFHRTRSDPEFVRYLYNEPMTREQARESLAVRIAATSLEQEGDWVSATIVERSSGQPIGDVAFNWSSVEHRTGEIGFTIDPARQGRGFATEAARAFLDWAFRDFGLHRVIGRLEARNVASARVLEHLGMRLEAHFVENEWVKGEWGSELQYAILRREWER